jgi:fluoride exporter
MFHWSHLFAIAFGGALGAMSRYTLVSLTSQWLLLKDFRWFPNGFALGTFLANVIGCFLIGLLTVMLFEKFPQLAGQWRGFLVVGFLGAFTTFSSYSLETLLLFQNGQIKVAIFYATCTVLLCLTAVMLGYNSGKLLIN